LIDVQKESQNKHIIGMALQLGQHPGIKSVDFSMWSFCLVFKARHGIVDEMLNPRAFETHRSQKAPQESEEIFCTSPLGLSMGRSD
jgi:hypothetical protein